MTNKAFHSFEHFEAAWKKEKVPMPDLYSFKQQITNGANGNQPTRFRAWLRPVPVAIAIMCISVLLFAGPQASALFSKFILHGHNGEAVLELGETSFERTEIDNKLLALYKPYQKDMDAIQKGLMPGGSALFLLTEAYQLDRHYYSLQNEHIYTDIHALVQAVDVSFRTPTVVPSGYRFSEGKVTYESEAVDPSIMEQWVREAANAELAYIVKPWPLTSKASAVDYEYSKLEYPVYSSLNVRMTEATGYTTASNFHYADTEIVFLEGGVEAVYQRAPFPSLTFVLSHDGNHFQYEVTGSNFTTEEDLFDFAKSLVPEAN